MRARINDVELEFHSDKDKCFLCALWAKVDEHKHARMFRRRETCCVRGLLMKTTFRCKRGSERALAHTRRNCVKSCAAAVECVTLILKSEHINFIRVSI